MCPVLRTLTTRPGCPRGPPQPLLPPCSRAAAQGTAAAGTAGCWHSRGGDEGFDVTSRHPRPRRAPTTLSEDLLATSARRPARSTARGSAMFRSAGSATERGAVWSRLCRPGPGQGRGRDTYLALQDGSCRHPAPPRPAIGGREAQGPSPTGPRPVNQGAGSAPARHCAPRPGKGHGSGARGPANAPVGPPGQGTNSRARPPGLGSGRAIPAPEFTRARPSVTSFYPCKTKFEHLHPDMDPGASGVLTGQSGALVAPHFHHNRVPERHPLGGITGSVQTGHRTRAKQTSL